MAFSKCSWSDNLISNESWADLDKQPLTATVELVGSVCTLLTVFAFYAVAVAQCVLKRRRRGGPGDEDGVGTAVAVAAGGAALLRWDTSPRVHSLAALLLVNSASFFLSAGVGFRPWNQTHDQCTAQALLYQFSITGSILETLALTVNLYLVLVKTMPPADLHRPRHAVPTFAGVYGVAALLALVPLAIQVGADVPLYDASTKFGYCNLSIESNCAAAFIFFWVVPACLVLVAGTCLNVVVARHVIPVYRIMRVGVKTRLLLFITRRVVVLALQMCLLLLQTIYVVLTLNKTHALGFFLSVSFFAHGCGLTWLVVFLIPDNTLSSCLARLHSTSAVGKRQQQFDTGLISTSETERGGGCISSTAGVELHKYGHDSAGGSGSGSQDDDAWHGGAGNSQDEEQCV